MTGSSKEPISISGRIMFITTFMFAILLIAHYTSWLYSMLAVTQFPFNSLEDLVADGSYTIGFTRGYSIEADLRVWSSNLSNRNA